MLKEIADRILKYLNIDDIMSDEGNSILDTHEVPVYDCIKGALNIIWDKLFYRDKNKPSLVLSNKKMDLLEYVKEYAWWCYGKKE